MIGLGLDVATSCGCAIVSMDGSGERLLDHWVADLSGKACQTWSVVDAVATRAARHCSPSQMVVAIELPYLDKNVHTLQVLARFCGRIEQVMEGAGAEVVFANAQSWQKAVLGRFGGRVRADRKKAAAIWARAVFGYGLLEDEADAAGLVTHVLRQLRCASKLDRMMDRTKATTSEGDSMGENANPREGVVL